MRWTLKELLLALAGAVVLALFMTYPLPAGLADLARVDTSDGEYSLWNVAWVAHALTTDPRHLFDANIFYPHAGMLASSEANLGAGILAIPAWLLTRNPYIAHNVVVLIGFCLSALCMYGLARHLTSSRTAGAAAGIAFAYCPYAFARMPHIQLQMTFVLPLALWTFHRFMDDPTWRRATALGASVALAGIFCGYFGVFAGLTVGLGTLTYAGLRRRWDVRFWGPVTWAAAVAIGLLLPLFLPYLQLQRQAGFERPLDEALRFATDWKGYLASAAWAHRWLLPWLGRWKEVLFPGIMATTLGAAGLTLALRRRAGTSASQTQHLWEAGVFYALLGGLAFWASFGPQAGLYQVLHTAIPIFKFLHAPGRFGLLVTLSLVVFTAIAVQWLARQRHGRWVPVVLPCLVVLDLVRLPVPLTPVRPFAPAYEVLARAPREAVAEFPFFPQRTVFNQHATYMLASTVHWQPLVNGYSDYIPADFRRVAPVLDKFPAHEAFVALAALQVRYLVFHLDRYDPRDRPQVAADLQKRTDTLRPMWTEGDVWLFERTP